MKSAVLSFRGEAPSRVSTATGDDRARVRVELDRAVASAFTYARPETVPPMTPLRWVYRLAGLYHLTHSTPALLGLAAERFAAAGRGTLARWARVRAREERYHDALALRDLLELGHDPEHVVAVLRPATAIRMVEYFARCATAPDPIGSVGYAYTVERLAMTVREADIGAIEALLPPGVRATRCLRVHSAAGSDADHVADTIAAVATLTRDERARIAEAAHETARICFTPDPAGPPGDAEIAALLQLPSSSQQSVNNRMEKPREQA